MNIENLPSKLMSCLSSILTEVRDRKETVTINNVPYRLLVPDEKSKQLISYFASTQTANVYLKNFHIDSLKITKIEHYLSKISKELLDKFRIVLYRASSLKSFVSTNLLVSGFSSAETLSTDLLNLIELYGLVFKPVLQRNGMKTN